MSGNLSYAPRKSDPCVDSSFAICWIIFREVMCKAVV